jgi:hypothetical protein
MLSHVVLVRADVLEEFIASIIRLTRLSELRTKLAVTNNGSILRRILSLMPLSVAPYKGT